MRRFAIAGCTLLLLAGAAEPAGAQADGAGAQKLFYGPCPAFRPKMAFDCYHSYNEVVAFLREAVRQYPGQARLESIGKSFQGRDLWVLTVTDLSTGDPAAKPAIWVDGGIDADEVVATEAALGLIHRLLTSADPEVKELRRTRTFYVAPVVIPDASELHHTTPIRPRDTTLRPWDDDNDGALDEDGPEDLDGDRQALQMRKMAPDGGWVKDERDGRLMRRRVPGDVGPFFRLYPEGTDNDEDGEFGEDPVGGIDPNRNYPGNWSATQRGGGPFAGSELEIRALLDFVAAHPNVAASQHFHSSGGVILRPPSVPDVRLAEADQRLYMDLARRGLEVTGYTLATSVFDWNWPSGTPNTRRGQIWRDREGNVRGWGEGEGGDWFGAAGVAPSDGSAYPAYGGSIDAMYELFGVLAFANEIYAMGQDRDRDGRIEPIEQLAYNDRALKGAAFKEWTAFDHPQLGRVEIGGWRKFGHNNPVPAELPEEVRRNVEFVLMQAAATPLLEIAEARAEDLGAGVYRVLATVRNTGYQPTELAIREERGSAVAVYAMLENGAGVELLSPKARLDLGTLSGYAEEQAEWIVRGPAGGAVTLTAYHPKAGKASATVQLSAAR